MLEQSAPSPQPGRASPRRRYIRFVWEENGLPVVAGLFDLNRPQIADQPSNNFGHVRRTRTLQMPEDVPKSRAVSTTAETLYKQSVAGRIREARTIKGISQGTLAMLIGKRRTHVNEWENAHHVPSWDNLELIGSELDVTAEWLLTGRNGGPA